MEDFQLRPQPGIESEEPAIVQAAWEIARGQSRDDAYRIHQLTAGRLRWGSSGLTDWTSVRLQSAVVAYQERKGVCGDFANLMTALCRAARIPAQSISGLRLPAYPPLWIANGAAWGSPAVTHGWVEFRTPRGWEMADPSMAHWLPLKSLAFGRNDGRHLSYGERISQDRIWNEMAVWAKAGGASVGSMVGPLRFAASAEREASFSPQATVKVIWNGRWFNLLLCLFLLASAVAAWNQRSRRRKRSQASQAVVHQAAPPNAALPPC